MKIKVAFLSSGLGNISRGFEITTELWYKSIKNNNTIKAKLFAGGNHSDSTKVWNLPRNGVIASYLRLVRLINDGVRLEQISFSIGFLFHLLFDRPDIIWLQEISLGEMLLFYRKVFNFKYKLIFCDGAPVGHELANKFDYIVFLHDYAFENAIKYGVSPDKCIVIPYLIKLPTSVFSQKEARTNLSIDNDKFVVLCVAAWNTHHKRIDYLLQEIANLNSSKILLFLCGQHEQGSDDLKKMAIGLGITTRWHTLSQKDLAIAYSAADIFILPSLHEGLGAVLIEAGAHYLPIICHPHDGGKFILGENYSGLTDLSISGNLTNKVMSYQLSSKLKEHGLSTGEIIRDKFNEQKLADTLLGFIKLVFKRSIT